MPVKIEYSNENGWYILSNDVGYLILDSDDMDELSSELKKEGF